MIELIKRPASELMNRLQSLLDTGRVGDVGEEEPLRWPMLLLLLPGWSILWYDREDGGRLVSVEVGDAVERVPTIVALLCLLRRSSSMCTWRESMEPRFSRGSARVDVAIAGVAVGV